MGYGFFRVKKHGSPGIVSFVPAFYGRVYWKIISGCTGSGTVKFTVRGHCRGMPGGARVHHNDKNLVWLENIVVV
jgi:hypothetical protein